MPKTIVNLYFRVGLGVARLAFKATVRAVDGAASAVGFGRPPAAEPAPTMATEHEQEPTVDATVVELSSQETVYDISPPTPLTPEEDRVKVVDDEPELVGELAEPGAEEGAGPEIAVEEPWEGYREMKSDEVIARIDDASAAELAVVELYEQAHKDRQSVVAAAERRHKAITGQGARS
jgi:hypothetical protein